MSSCNLWKPKKEKILKFALLEHNNISRKLKKSNDKLILQDSNG